jgi:hypothetical protein
MTTVHAGSRRRHAEIHPCLAPPVQRSEPDGPAGPRALHDLPRSAAGSERIAYSAGGRRYARSGGPCDCRDAVAQMGGRCLDPAGVGGYRDELPTEQGGGTGFDHCAAPRRRHSRLLHADLGSSARSLCSRAYYISPPARRSRSLSERRDDLRLSLWPDLGAKPRRLCQCCRPSRRRGGSRDHAVFQPHHADYDRLRDIVAVDPFARSLANLEVVLGQFYLAITVARLVTLELADRRR